MELYIIGFVLSIICFIRAVLLKINYIKSYAICLEYNTSNYGCVTYPLYEYEMMEDGKKVVYQSRGIANFWPKKGKRYKVFINKQNHNKVIAYNEYIFNIFWGTIFMIGFLIRLFF